MNIVDALKWRYATKVFDAGKKISDTNWNLLAQSLQLAPSSYGLQPWGFTVVENLELREKLKAHSWNQSQVVDCSHLVVLCTKEKIDESTVNEFILDMAKQRQVDASTLEGYAKMIVSKITKMDAAAQQAWAKNQVYIALGQLMTVAAAMKIDACPMEGFEPAKYDEILNLKAVGLKSAVVCPLGYRAVEDKYQHLKKVRFPIDKLFYYKN